MRKRKGHHFSVKSRVHGKMMKNVGGGNQQLQKLKTLLLNPLYTCRRCLKIPLLRCYRRDFTSYYTVLGLSPFSSKSDVKLAYKRLGEDSSEQDKIFREIKLAYESLMQKLKEEEEFQPAKAYDESNEWDEWIGFEGGIPVVHKPF